VVEGDVALSRTPLPLLVTLHFQEAQGGGLASQEGSQVKHLHLLSCTIKMESWCHGLRVPRLRGFAEANMLSDK